MSGEFGSGAADKAKTPKPPDKTPVPPDAQKSQHDTSHPANQTAQPDSKGGKDNHAPAGPPGGKPPDVGGPKGDTGPHQSGDTHRSGDGPVKINEVPGPKTADGPHHGDHQPPGPRMVDNLTQLKAQIESHWVAPHPDAAMRPVSDVKIDRHPETFTVTLDLNDGCRNDQGKLDPAKVRTRIADLFREAHQDRTMSRLNNDAGPAPKIDGKGYPHGGHREIHLVPPNLTVGIVHFRSYQEFQQVQKAFGEFHREHKVNGHVEMVWPKGDAPGPASGSGPRPRREGPATPHPHAGNDRVQPQHAQREVHPQGQAPRQVPPVRQMPHVQPHTPWR